MECKLESSALLRLWGLGCDELGLCKREMIIMPASSVYLHVCLLHHAFPAPVIS